MILDFYGLREEPFKVTPDPSFLLLGRAHREALASLFCALHAQRGFIALIAQAGMGKTTLLLQLMQRLERTASFAFLFQTQCGPDEFFRFMLTDMGIDTRNKGLPELHRELNERLAHLKRAGKQFVLIVDEAQNLGNDVLETVRLISDFETSKEKLIQIVLSGQPGLADRLSSPSLIQLRQRISTVCRIDRLGHEETETYIRHRLAVAGHEGKLPFTSDALALIAAHSQGIPRNINNLCYNGMALGCALRKKTIDATMIREVLQDLDLEPLGQGRVAPQLAPEPSPSISSKTVREVPIPGPLVLQPMPSARTGWRVFAMGALASILILAGLTVYPKVRSFVAAQIDRTVTGARRADLRKLAVPPPPAESLKPQVNSPGPVQLKIEDNKVMANSQGLEVEVKPQDTLTQISVRNLGKYDQQTLRKIESLNQDLTDPDLIQVGQMIRLPDPSADRRLGPQNEPRGTNQDSKSSEYPQ